MSKDPRDGLKLRLGYEVAREIERTLVIAPGVSDAAVRAVNSVLYQRIQDQIIDDNPTAQILEERIRDINITNIASENNINKSDLIAVLQSSGFQVRSVMVIQYAHRQHWAWQYKRCLMA